MILIIDYGMGNISSIANMIKKAGGVSTISKDPKDIKYFSKIILPGVGAFDNAIIKLKDKGYFYEIQNQSMKEKTIILGICLGMQLLTGYSEEGNLDGLGLISGFTKRFNFTSSKYKIPHMGWNDISIIKTDPLFTNIPDPIRFYFVHSYHVILHNNNDILSTTSHCYDFISSFKSKNIIGVQFHPEKSHNYGISFFKNFINLQGSA